MLLSRLITVCLVAGGGALSIKCGGRLPLQSWGADLYCGVGAPACPIGSYCHMDSDGFANFAVCCPNLLASAPFSSSFPLYTSSFPLYSPLLPPLASLPLYSNPAPAVPLYTPALSTAPVIAITKAPTIPEPEICPETGKQKLSCPINSCLTSDCFGVPGASCMVDYCGNCGPKWYGPYNQVLTAEQCNWLPAWSARLQAFATVQNQAQPMSALNFGPMQPQPQPQFITQASSQSPQPIASQFFTQGSMSPQPISSPQFSAQFSTRPIPSPQLPAQVETIVPLPLSQTNVAGTRCPAPPDCGLDFLKASNSTNSTNNQQMGGTPAEKQERFWQEQAQQTTCRYENPQMAPNGCLMGCGTLVCEGPVRFLEIAMGQNSAVATWVPPLSAALGQTYTAELSYDGITWRNLPLEQPWATFARFEIEENKPFQVRVTAAGYPSIVKKFGYSENATMPAASVQIIEEPTASEEAESMEASLEAPPLSLYNRQV